MTPEQALALLNLPQSNNGKLTTEQALALLDGKPSNPTQIPQLSPEDEARYKEDMAKKEVEKRENSIPYSERPLSYFGDMVTTYFTKPTTDSTPFSSPIIGAVGQGLTAFEDLISSAYRGTDTGIALKHIIGDRSGSPHFELGKQFTKLAEMTKSESYKQGLENYDKARASYVAQEKEKEANGDYDGFWGGAKKIKDDVFYTAGNVVDNPAVIGRTIESSLPSIGSGIITTAATGNPALGATVGSSVGAGMAAADILHQNQEFLKTIPQYVLDQSPYYNELKQRLDLNDDEARYYIANDLKENAVNMATAAGVEFFLERFALRGLLTPQFGNRALNALTGGLREAGTEYIQEPTQTVMGNRAVINTAKDLGVKTDRKLTDNVGEAMVLAPISGLAVGTTMGAVNTVNPKDLLPPDFDPNATSQPENQGDNSTVQPDNATQSQSMEVNNDAFKQATEQFADILTEEELGELQDELKRDIQDGKLAEAMASQDNVYADMAKAYANEIGFELNNEPETMPETTEQGEVAPEIQQDDNPYFNIPSEITNEDGALKRYSEMTPEEQQIFKEWNEKANQWLQAQQEQTQQEQAQQEQNQGISAPITLTNYGSTNANIGYQGFTEEQNQAIDRKRRAEEAIDNHTQRLKQQNPQSTDEWVEIVSRFDPIFSSLVAERQKADQQLVDNGVAWNNGTPIPSARAGKDYHTNTPTTEPTLKAEYSPVKPRRYNEAQWQAMLDMENALVALEQTKAERKGLSQAKKRKHGAVLRQATQDVANAREAMKSAGISTTEFNQNRSLVQSDLNGTLDRFEKAKITWQGGYGMTSEQGYSQYPNNAKPTEINNQPRVKTAEEITEENIRNGKLAMQSVLKNKQDARGAMHRDELGRIDFIWGTEGRLLENGKRKGAKGVAHIIEKRMNVDGMTEAEVTDFVENTIPEVIAKGRLERDYQVEDSRSVAIVHNGVEVHFIQKGKQNAWLLTGFVQHNQTVEQGGGATTPDLRTNSPIRSRTEVGASDNQSVDFQLNDVKQINAITGATSTIELGSQGTREFDYQLIEADELTANLKPNEYQNRDRTSTESQAQIMDYANNLNPSYLGASVDTTQGAPTVDENYGVFAGNGRLSAIKQAYARNPEKATAYRDYLAQNAGQFGLTAEQVAGMKQPVLVRQVKGEIDVKQAVQDSNFNTGLDKGTLGNAKEHADYITDDMLDLVEYNTDGSLNLSGKNNDFVQALVGKIPVELRPKFFNADRNGGVVLTQQGVTLVENALLYKAFNDDTVFSERFLTDLIASTEESNQRVKKALIATAGKIIQTRGSDYDISSDIVRAYGAVTQAKGAKQSIEEVIEQGDMLDPISGRAKGLARLFESPKSINEVKGVLDNYLDNVINSKLNQTDQNSLFGEEENPTSDELLRSAGAKFSRNPQNRGRNLFKRERGYLDRILGKALADNIELLTREELAQYEGIPQDRLSEVEGFFDPTTGKLHLVPENIHSTKRISGADRLAWVAWHELSHKGLGGRYGAQLNAVLNNAGKNPIVKRLAKGVQQHINDKLTYVEAVEEALVELSSAVRSGNWTFLENKLKVNVPAHWKSDSKLDRLIRSVERILKRIAGAVLGKDFSKVDDFEILDLLKGLQTDVRNLAKSGEKGDLLEMTSRVSTAEISNSSPLSEIDDKRLLQILQGDNDTRTRFSFAGRNAKTANHSLLEQAERDLASGKNAEEIRKETGWFKGADGKWRFEIDDSKFKLKKSLLEEIVKTTAKFKGKNLEDVSIKDIFNFIEKRKGKEPEVNAYIKQRRQLKKEIKEEQSRVDFLQQKAELTPEEMSELDKLVNSSWSKNEQVFDLDYLINDRIAVHLDDLINHKELFEAYPDLKKLKVGEELEFSGSNGGYSSRADVISLTLKGRSNKEILSTLMHEIQHAIQQREDFARGGNPSMFDGMTNTKLAKSQFEALLSKASVKLANDFEAFEKAKIDYVLRPNDEKLGEKYEKAYYNLVYNHADGFDLYNAYEAMKEADNELVNPFYTYKRLAGEVEARNVQARLGFTEEERAERSPRETQDVANREQILISQDREAFSLDESRDSEFAKAVDEVVNGNVSRGYISMGATPDVLKMLGYPDTKIRIQGKTIEKVMGEHLGIEKGKHSHLHNLTPETLKLLPQNINNPVAVFNSTTVENGKVVLTELTETDTKTGEDKPIIAALHLKPTKDGVEIIDVASAYGRSKGQLETAFNNDLLYVNKEKAQHLNTERLQLSWDFTSDVELSARDIKTEQDLSQYQSENSGIRFSLKPSVEEQMMNNKPSHHREEGIIRDFIAGEFKKGWKSFKSKMDKALRDDTRPFDDWVRTLPLSPEMQKMFIGAKDRAYHIRMDRNSKVIQRFIKPLMKNIEAVAKKYNLTTEQAKMQMEYWYSARYSIEKNNELLKREEKAMIDARAELANAQQNGNQADIQQAARVARRAERQYKDRLHDVHLTDWSKDADGNYVIPRKVGTAGGWSIPHAKRLMAIAEQHIPANEIEQAMQPIQEAVKWAIREDYRSGRISLATAKARRANPNYVPLTGNPDENSADDRLGEAGMNVVNTSRDHSMKGREKSEADGAVDALMGMLDKVNANTGWGEFKERLDAFYESEVAKFVNQGLTEREAKAKVASTYGITKTRLKGTTRSSDNVVIRKFNDIAYEYKLPQEAIDGLIPSTAFIIYNNLMKRTGIPFLTTWHARGVTAYRAMFPPKNMMRDVWEKSTVLPTREIYRNGVALSDKEKAHISHVMLWKNINPATQLDMLKATRIMAFKGTDALDVRDPTQAALKRLIELGGVSNFYTYLTRTKSELREEIKRLGKINHKAFDGAVSLVSAYGSTFEYVSSLSAYLSLTEAGIDERQAAELTLNLTNFYKHGAVTKFAKPFYMFLNPTIQGHANLLQMTQTKRGRYYLMSRIFVATLLLSLLLEDDDEAGNQSLTKGDMVREIKIPIFGDKDVRIPVGYGAPQMVMAVASNLVKGGSGQIPMSEAAANVITMNTKMLMPIAPPEVSPLKHPSDWLLNTITPTVGKPLVQIATNRDTFGRTIYSNSSYSKLPKAAQGKAETADFWKDFAMYLYEEWGISQEPEVYRHLFESYKGMLGDLGQYISNQIENPNRALRGKTENTMWLDDWVKAFGENRFSTGYYEAKEDAQKVVERFELLKQEGDREKIRKWLEKDNHQKTLEWYQRGERQLQGLREARSRLEKRRAKGGMSDQQYTEEYRRIADRMEQIYRKQLHEWRKQHGLRTKDTSK